MKKFLRRLQYLLHRRRFDQELANEMEFHREMLSVQRGNQTIPFGTPLRLREESRDIWGFTSLDRLSQDLRYAIRILRKSPGFTLTAILMLALGIGVNVALFGFFNLMVLRPLPVRDPTAILRFERTSPDGGGDNFAYPETAFYRAHSRSLSAIWAQSGASFTIDTDSPPINADLITANFFDQLGALPTLGRLLDPYIDESPNATPVIVLSHKLWQSRFASDPSVIGKTIRLNSKPATIIGVTSQTFSGLGGTPDAWLPISQAPYFLNLPKALTDFSDSGINVQMWGRLPSNITPKTVEGELKSLAAELHRQHPVDTWKDETLLTAPGGYAVRIRHEMYPLLALIAALGLLILSAASITLGSLLLAKGTTRDREISIRSAIGASRSRLVRQLLTESFLLSSLGSATGVLLGYLTLRALMLWGDVPVWLNPSPDWRVLTFALAIGLLATLLFGVTPALQAARQRNQSTKARQLLVTSQIAASCILLIVAALLVRALQHAVSTHPGFAYDNILTVDNNFRGYTPAQARTYFDQLESRLHAIPGIESVALVSNPPLGHRFYVSPQTIAGHRVNIHFNNVDADVLQTLQIPLLTGRSLRPGDKNEIVISEALARLAWPNENPLGKQLKAADNNTIVGVCGDAHLVSPEDSDAVEVYRYAQLDLMPSMVMLVRTSRPAEMVPPIIVGLARQLDPNLFPKVELLKSAYQEKISTARYAALSVTFLGTLALLLACIGMFGLTLYVVSQRTKEIGIRMALGASPANVIAIVLRQFSIPVAAGLLIGLAGAAALSQLLRQLLYGLSSFDALSYLASLTFFAAGIAFAAILPAKRALDIDPMEALRYD